MYPNKIKQANVTPLLIYKPSMLSLIKKYGINGINPETKYDVPMIAELCENILINLIKNIKI